MKTPTNFIPIIGPLYADDLHVNRISVAAIIMVKITKLIFNGNQLISKIILIKNAMAKKATYRIRNE
jgi:hypothetical protein